MPLPSSSKNCSKSLPVTLKPVELKIPPAVALCPVCGLNKEFLKNISYFVDDDIVGVKLFLILIVVIFDNILVSTSSIRPVNFECL